MAVLVDGVLRRPGPGNGGDDLSGGGLGRRRGFILGAGGRNSRSPGKKNGQKPITKRWRDLQLPYGENTGDQLPPRCKGSGCPRLSFILLKVLHPGNAKIYIIISLILAKSRGINASGFANKPRKNLDGALPPRFRSRTGQKAWKGTGEGPFRSLRPRSSPASAGFPSSALPRSGSSRRSVG